MYAVIVGQNVRCDMNKITVEFAPVVVVIMTLLAVVMAIKLDNSNAEVKRLKDRSRPFQISSYKAGVIDGMTIINGLSQGVYTNATQASNAWVSMQVFFEKSIFE